MTDFASIHSSVWDDSHSVDDAALDQLAADLAAFQVHEDEKFRDKKEAELRSDDKEKGVGDTGVEDPVVEDPVVEDPVAESLPVYEGRVLDTAKGEIRLLNLLPPEENDPNGPVVCEMDHYLLAKSCTHFIEFEKAGLDIESEKNRNPIVPEIPHKKGFRKWVKGLRSKSAILENSRRMENETFHRKELYHYVLCVTSFTARFSDLVLRVQN